MKPTLKEQCNDVLRHLAATGAFLFRLCHNRDEKCQERYAEWQEALKKAERLIGELPDG